MHAHECQCQHHDCKNTVMDTSPALCAQSMSEHLCLPCISAGHFGAPEQDGSSSSDAAYAESRQ